MLVIFFYFFFSSRRRHTRCSRDWSSDVCSSDLKAHTAMIAWIPWSTAKSRAAGGVSSMLAGSEWNVSSPRRAARGSQREIGRASCRERCRSGWARYDEKKKKNSKEDGIAINEEC